MKRGCLQLDSLFFYNAFSDKPLGCSTQHSQVRYVADNCLPHRFVFDIGNIEFSTGLLYDLIDFRIMDVRDPGEQMVLNLEVETTYQPTYHTVAGSKVGSCFQLVNSPFVLQLAC